MRRNLMTSGANVAYAPDDGGTASPPPPPPPPATWFAGMDDATRAYVENRGLATKTLDEAFAAAAKSHQEAQAFIGAPPEQLLRLPKEATDVNGWDAVWQRLGKPADAKGYDFSAIKRADGTDLAADFVATIQAAAASANLPVAAAQAMAGAFLKHNEAAAATALAESTAALETAKAALKQNWGANFDANMFVSKQAAAALGVDAAGVEALEKVIGYDKVMELFRKVGSQIGEDKFVNGGGGGGDKVMTREGAMERIEELKGDKEWAKRFLDGGTKENKEFQALTTIAYSPA